MPRGTDNFHAASAFRVGHMDETDGRPSSLPRIYTIAEAAEHLRVTKEWLRTQLQNQRLEGLKLGSRWCMTEQQILAAIEAGTSKVRERDSPNNPYGVTNRSWTYHQRAQIPGTPQYNRRMGIKPEPVEAPNTQPMRDYRMVLPESAEAIAKMAPLSDSQRAFLDRVRREREVAFVAPTARRTVESLARRGLVTYEVVHELNEKTRCYVQKFTVRPKDAPTPNA